MSETKACAVCGDLLPIDEMEPCLAIGGGKRVCDDCVCWECDGDGIVDCDCPDCGGHDCPECDGKGYDGEIQAPAGTR